MPEYCKIVYTFRLVLLVCILSFFLLHFEGGLRFALSVLLTVLVLLPVFSTCCYWWFLWCTQRYSQKVANRGICQAVVGKQFGPCIDAPCSAIVIPKHSAMATVRPRPSLASVNLLPAIHRSSDRHENFCGVGRLTENDAVSFGGNSVQYNLQNIKQQCTLKVNMYTYHIEGSSWSIVCNIKACNQKRLGMKASYFASN